MPCISLTSEALTRRGKAEPWSLLCGAPWNRPVCPNLEALQTEQLDGKMERVLSQQTPPRSCLCLYVKQSSLSESVSPATNEDLCWVILKCP